MKISAVRFPTLSQFGKIYAIVAVALLSLIATTAFAAIPVPGQSLFGTGILTYPSNSLHPKLEMTGRVAEIKTDILMNEVSASPAGAFSVEFKETDMVVKSSKLNWLVVSPTFVELKGTCTINEAEGFSFIVRVDDSSRSGKTALRLKIWETENPRCILFDNQRGEEWGVPFRATSALLGGSIAVR